MQELRLGEQFRRVWGHLEELLRRGVSLLELGLGRQEELHWLAWGHLVELHRLVEQFQRA